MKMTSQTYEDISTNLSGRIVMLDNIISDCAEHLFGKSALRRIKVTHRCSGPSYRVFLLTIGRISRRPRFLFEDRGLVSKTSTKVIFAQETEIPRASNSHGLVLLSPIHSTFNGISRVSWISARALKVICISFDLLAWY